MILAEARSTPARVRAVDGDSLSRKRRVWAEIAWLGAALAASALFASWSMAGAFGPGDVVQDDARSHIFWMERFRDPEIFSDFVLADYWQSLAQPGYSGLYWLLSRQIDPLLASKLIPPVLGLVSALFTFLLVRRLHPAPLAAFLGTVLVSRYFWQYDDLASGSPRPYVLPLLAMQVWALAADRLALAVSAVVLAALFYPMAAVLGLGLLGVRLVKLRMGLPGFSSQRSTWIAFLVASVIVGGLLLQSQVASAQYGPMASAAQAREMPEFGRAGRIPYFSDDPYRFWLRSNLSGFDLRAVDVLAPDVPVLFEYSVLAALLPVLWLLRGHVRAAARLSRRSTLLGQLLLASGALFLLAHLVAFRLYFPSRYVKWSVPLALGVAAGLAAAIVIEELSARWRPSGMRLIAGGLTAALCAGMVLYPGRFNAHFERDRHPVVSAYLREQPKNILVAGVPIDTDFVPTLTGRRVLTNRQNTYPMLLGFYLPMRAKTEDLIQAYYSETVGPVVQFAERYGVDLFLVNRSAFQLARFGDAWGGTPGERWEPFTSEIGIILQRTRRFSLLDLASRCAALDDGGLAVVPTGCLSGQLLEGQPGLIKEPGL